MQFERTKHAKIQMEESKAKFFGLINFLFTFRKAISNAEGNKSQIRLLARSSTHDQWDIYLFIYLFPFWLELEQNKNKNYNTWNDKIENQWDTAFVLSSKTVCASVLLGKKFFNHSLSYRLLWDKQRNSRFKKIIVEKVLMSFTWVKVAL